MGHSSYPRHRKTVCIPQNRSRDDNLAFFRLISSLWGLPRFEFTPWPAISKDKWTTGFERRSFRARRKTETPRRARRMDVSINGTINHIGLVCKKRIKEKKVREIYIKKIRTAPTTRVVLKARISFRYLRIVYTRRSIYVDCVMC